MSPRSGAARKSLSSLLTLACAFSPLVRAEEAASGKPTEDPKKSCRVRAEVVAPDGKTPVEGAVLRLYHLDSGKTFASSPSTAKGTCEVTGLPFGYFDLAVEATGGLHIGGRVVDVRPAGSLTLSVRLVPRAAEAPSWWGPPPGGTAKAAEAAGVAEIRVRARGREFWTSPPGLAIAGVGLTAVLIALAGGGNESQAASPSEP